MRSPSFASTVSSLTCPIFMSSCASTTQTLVPLLHISSLHGPLPAYSSATLLPTKDIAALISHHAASSFPAMLGLMRCCFPSPLTLQVRLPQLRSTSSSMTATQSPHPSRVPRPLSPAGMASSSPLDDPTMIVYGPPAPLAPPTLPSPHHGVVSDASTCGVVPHHRTLPPRYRHLWHHRRSCLWVCH